MSTNGIRAFDKTLQLTHIWLNEVTDELGFGDRRTALKAIRAVLHALRDRLTVVEAAQLSAQLPLLLRGVFFEGWAPHPDGNPTGSRRREDFLARVSDAFDVASDDHDPQDVVRAVLIVLERHVSAGEIEDVVRQLPDELLALWPEEDAAAG